MLVDSIQHQTATKPCNSLSFTASSHLYRYLLLSAQMLYPVLLAGTLLGREALAGLLPGAIVVALQLGLSGSNTGGAWNNAKRYIEAGNLGAKRAKGSKVCKRWQQKKRAVCLYLWYCLFMLLNLLVDPSSGKEVWHLRCTLYPPGLDLVSADSGSNCGLHCTNLVGSQFHCCMYSCSNHAPKNANLLPA